MYPLIIAIAALCAVGGGLYAGGVFSVWGSLTAGLIAAILIQVGTGFIMRKKVGAVMQELQDYMTTASGELRSKMEKRQMRGGNIKKMMDEAQQEQNAMLEEALKIVEKLNAYTRWTFLLNKQINTMKMQFYFQMKAYEKADQYLDKMIIADPMGCCMVMIRYFKTGKDALYAKTFAKYSKRFKAKAALIYATDAYIQLQKKNVDAAIKTLAAGRTATGDETLINNYQLLLNGKEKSFSNAPYGEMWYALGLELPKNMQSVKDAPAMRPEYKQFLARNNSRPYRRR